MKKFKDHTLSEYLDVLSKREPVPGGGSVAAAAGSMGAGLMIMAAQYSLGKSAPKRVEERIQKIINKLELIRNRLLEIVDEDAQAYLRYRQIPKSDIAEKKRALKDIAGYPVEVSELCRTAANLSGYLAQHGNTNLLSDINVSAEILLAAYRSSLILSKENE